MLRTALSLIAFAALLLCASCGRTGQIEKPPTGCTDDSQCRHGRVCREGKCLYPEELDGGGKDGGTDASSCVGDACGIVPLGADSH